MSEKNIKLVIAEKPSVAQSIAKVIGADKREDGYLEGNQVIFYPVWTDTECRKSYGVVTASCSGRSGSGRNLSVRLSRSTSFSGVSSQATQLGIFKSLL